MLLHAFIRSEHSKDAKFTPPTGWIPIIMAIVFALVPWLVALKYPESQVEQPTMAIIMSGYSGVAAAIMFITRREPATITVWGLITGLLMLYFMWQFVELIIF